MRAFQTSSFNTRFINKSIGDSIILAELLDPAKTATHGIEPNARLIRVSRKAVVHPGNLIQHYDDYFAVGDHARDSDTITYKLILLPDRVTLVRKLAPNIDTLTGLATSYVQSDPEIIPVSKMGLGFKTIAGKQREENKQYICATPMSIGDTIDGEPIRELFNEQGIMKAIV